MAKTLVIPILAGGAAVLLLAGSKKSVKGKKVNVRWGIRVSSDCKKVDVVNVSLFNQFMFGAFSELVAIDSSLSLIQITDALFGDIAPNCSGFPEAPESDQVAELYAVIARNVGQFMIADPNMGISSIGELIDDATQIAFVDWYRAWRNYPSTELPEVPNNQVSFSSSLSSFKIGVDWYAQTVLPFVAEAAESGNFETAFEDFVATRGVKVGKFVMPISDLPQDNDIVIRFLDDLEAAIDQAGNEIGA